MKRSRIVWGLLAVLWGAFFVWYTNLRGPLSDAEIATFLDRFAAQRLEQGGADPESLAVLRRFLESDTGDDFVMLNLIQMNDPRLDSGGESPQQALDRYMAYMWPALLSRASHPVFTGTAAAGALDVWGIDDATEWTTGALMRYRSRRDMMEIAANTAFADSHAFKAAAMARTIAVPLDPWLSAGDPRLLLALIFVVTGLLLTRAR